MGTVATYYPQHNVIELITQDASGQDRTDAEITVKAGDDPTEVLLSAGWALMCEWFPGDEGSIEADVMEA